jgi:hypothetical protein
MTFTVVTARERYLVDEHGNIGRPQINLAPSGNWKALALIRYHGFGIAETIPFAKWPERIAELNWRYKNGKPRYHMRDLDHGTTREWGEPILQVYSN